MLFLNHIQHFYHPGMLMFSKITEVQLKKPMKLLKNNEKLLRNMRGRRVNRNIFK